MKNADIHLVRPGHPARIHETDPAQPLAITRRGGPDKEPYNPRDRSALEKATEANIERLVRLQELLYAEGTRSLLVVLQGMDTSGKDGVLRSVFRPMSPLGCVVTSFKKPTELELAHDYLWRVHHAVPPKGFIGVFNRSHYEDVLIVRVRGLVPESVWRQRYEQINAFEKHLGQNGVRIVKFFLHISKDEQKTRLRERLADTTKHWKFNPGDLEERKRWPAYMKAYEDALTKCSTPHAPWYAVPADRKWYRNWVVSDVLRRTLEDMDPKPPKPAWDPKKITIV